MSWFISKFNSIINNSPDEEEKNGNHTDAPDEDTQSNANSDKLQITEILGSILKTVKLGSDVLRLGISLPCTLYEPLSILQRQAEMLEYNELLDRANQCNDPIDRMVYVAAFAVSAYSGTKRFHNNFNPILGETFEYVDKRNSTKCFGEQVSHHPPISATHAENERWVLYQNSRATTKFLGNAIDINTHARTHIYFPNYKDHFYYTNPLTRVHNIVLGTMSMEHYGELHITNLKSQESCKIFFKKCSFFESVDTRIEGWVKNSEGETVVNFEGLWDEYMNANWLVNTDDSPAGKEESVWRLYEDNFTDDKYLLTKYALLLNELDEETKSVVPPTDSRLRLDRKSLELGNATLATKYKKMMEERQRSDKSRREEEEIEWEPVWFKEIPDEEGGHIWVYYGDYWEQRDKKLNRIKENQDTNDLLNGGRAQGTAADFKSYPLIEDE